MPDDDTGGLDEVLAGRSFDIVLRGYDRVQVDRHLDWLEDQLLQARSEAARDRPSYAQLGERITRILELADQEAESIRRAALSATDDARAEASKIAERAQAEAGATTEQARANAERILAEARTQARQILDAAGREVQAMAEQRDKI
jgi:cell division septum initiation protein DivIVA